MRSDPEEWLSRAKSCLTLAKTPVADGAYLEDQCYQAQQAAGKGLKAILWMKNEEPQRTHDIAVLLKLSSEICQYPPGLAESASLTDYAVRTRYPDDFQPVDEGQYARAVELATCVVDWVERVVLTYRKSWVCKRGCTINRVNDLRYPKEGERRWMRYGTSCWTSC
jgi:HEPN domain-containing protein